MTENEETKVRDAVGRVAQIALGGGIRELAAVLNVSTQAIYKWIAEGVPVKRALQMSVMTKGQVQWYELAPKVLDELRQPLTPKGDVA